MKGHSIMERMQGEHLYKIQSSMPHFCAGFLPDGTVALIGVQIPSLVMVVFDADGNYLRTSLKKLSADPAEDEFTIHINKWQVELGLTPGTISVRQFYLPERFIGITYLPEHYQEVLDHPESFTAERLQEIRGDIEAWRGSGAFVFDFDIDYYMSEEGDVDST